MKETCFYEFGPFKLDAIKNLLWLRGHLVALEPKVAKTLVVLAQAKGELVQKEELIRQVWDGDAVTDDSVNRHIYILRRTLAKGVNGKECIRNIPKRGYCLDCPIVEHRLSTQSPPAKPLSGSRDRADCSYKIEVTDSAGENCGSGQHLVAESQDAGLPSVGIPPPKAAPLDVIKLKWFQVRASSNHQILASVVVGAIVCAILTLVLRSNESESSPQVTGYHALTHNKNEKEGLFTDGLRLYFRESLTDRQIIASLPQMGGEIVYIPTSFQDFYLLNASPDGSSLYAVADFHSQNPSFWRQPLPGGSPQPLNGISPLTIIWATDSKSIAYTDNERHSLFVATADGSHSKRLFARVPELIVSPHWFPDGRILRFLLANPKIGTSALWEVGSDGSNPHPLLPGWNSTPREGIGNWTADGKYYVFHCVRNERMISGPSAKRETGFTRLVINRFA